MSEQTSIHRRQTDLAAISKSLGSLAAKALQQERPAASQKELMQGIADTALDADTIRAILEASVSVLQDNGIPISNKFLGISRMLVCIQHRNEEMRERLIAFSGSELNETNALLEFLESSTSEQNLPKPYLPLVLTAIRHQVSNFGKPDKLQAQRLSRIIDRYPRFGPQGQEKEYFKGRPDDIIYAEQTISMLCDLARYVQRRQLVLASSKQDEQDVSIAPRIEWLVSALSLNGGDQEIAYTVVRCPLSLVGPVFRLYRDIHQIRKTAFGDIIALSETIRRLHDAELTALFLVRDNDSAPGDILSAMWKGAEQIVSSSTSLDTNHLHGIPNLQELHVAINLTAMQAFSGLGGAAQAWRQAWLSRFSEELVNERLFWEFNKPDFDKLTVRERLSPYARLMFDEGMSLDKAMSLQYANGEHFDGGLVCLAYMRVLEVELNYLVRRLLKVGVRPKIESSKDQAKGLVKGMDALEDGAISALGMGGLRSFFGHIRNMTQSTPETKELVSRVFTEEGIAALGDQRIRDCISDDICREFRNPPAHAAFVDWGVVERCRRHAISTLLAMNGYADASGQKLGWCKSVTILS